MDAINGTHDPDPPDSDSSGEGGYSEPADTSYDDGPGTEQGNIPDSSDPDYQ